MRKELALYFPEQRIVTLTRFLSQVMPPMAAISLAVQITFLGVEFAPQALAVAALFISIPFQLTIWLGMRSKEKLPPTLVAFYREIQKRMIEQGCECRNISRKLRYEDLARLLKRAFDEVDKIFTQKFP